MSTQAIIDVSHFSDQQREAYDKLRVWAEKAIRFREQSKKLGLEWDVEMRDEVPVFRLFGYAGTGKTTTLRAMLSEFFSGKKIMYATYTGKAALVMQRAGMHGASTIHSLIYKLQKMNEEYAKTLDKQIQQAKEDGAPIEDIAVMEQKLAETGEMVWLLNRESALLDADILAIDEVSMVDQEMAKDLLSYGVPIIVLGDPGQLPPPKDDAVGYFTQAIPDVMLTEIHRQAEGNPIIDLATKARLGRSMALGEWGGSWYQTTAHMSDADATRAMMEADQIFTGKNATRQGLNVRYRTELGYGSSIFPVPGDRLICTKNNKQKGLFNGLMAEVIEVGEHYPDFFHCTMRTELGAELVDVPVLSAHFQGYSDPEALKRLKWWQKKDNDEFDFGYAMTVHKSQGSQWSVPFFFDDKMFLWKKAIEAGLRKQWLYTGITRAAEHIHMLKMI